MDTVAVNPVTPRYTPFALDPATIASAADYVLAGTIKAHGHDVVLHAAVTAGTLAHLKVTQALVPGGPHVTLAEDTDFATATDAIPYVLGSNIHQTAAGGAFQLRLSSGAAEYKLYAKKAAADTTLALSGAVLPQG